MSIAAVSSNTVQQASDYFAQRRADLQQLGKDLQSGDTAAALQDFNTLQTLAQSGPLSNGDVFKSSQRQQDFATIGQDLQSGDLAGAQQAYAQLQATFHHQHRIAPPQAASSSSNSAAANGASSSSASNAASGPEIVLNLGNATPGEQITIDLQANSKGGEQVSISVANQQNQNPEQITLNLDPNSNQRIVLNLFSSPNSSATQSSNVNLSA